jgi:DNA-binding beta-propeller fold protein YncE
VVDTGNARVQQFTVAGAFVRSWSVGAGATGIAVDAGGSVYVADRVAGRVAKYTADGDFVLDFEGGDGGFSGAEGVGVDPSGRVIVTDTGNDRVQIFTTAGVFAIGFGGSGAFEAPSGVATDCRANVFVLDTGNSRVQKFGASASAVCPAVVGGSAFRAVASAQRRPGFTATMKTTRSTAGVVSRLRGLVRERGAGARGTFRGRVVGPAGGALRAFRAFARGSWRARFDVVADPRTGASTASGVALVSPAGRRVGGQLCLSFRLKVSVRGRKVTTTGSFSTLGGSGPARRLRAGGSFSQTLNASSSEFRLRGNGVPGRRAGRSLPASCRRLR